jgi:hypothetical protein
MKAKLHIDLDKEQKDLIKVKAYQQGLTIKGYIMSLVSNDIQEDRQVHSGGAKELLRWPQRD